MISPTLALARTALLGAITLFSLIYLGMIAGLVADQNGELYFNYYGINPSAIPANALQIAVSVFDFLGGAALLGLSIFKILPVAVDIAVLAFLFILSLAANANFSSFEGPGVTECANEGYSDCKLAVAIQAIGWIDTFMILGCLLLTVILVATNSKGDSGIWMRSFGKAGPGGVESAQQMSTYPNQQAPIVQHAAPQQEYAAPPLQPQQQQYGTPAPPAGAAYPAGAFAETPAGPRNPQAAEVV